MGNDLYKCYKENTSRNPYMPFLCYKNRPVPLSSFVNLDRSLPCKSISLHVPGNCYLVTVSAAVAIGCAVDWGRRTESPFWWWVLLHQLRMRRRSRASAQVETVILWDCEELYWQHPGNCIPVNRTYESSSPAYQLIRVDVGEKHCLIPVTRKLFCDKWN